jgi:hypothetical protein
MDSLEPFLNDHVIFVSLLIYSPLAFPLARPQSLLLFLLERHVIFLFCQFICHVSDI